jgi:hypothetical protein
LSLHQGYCISMKDSVILERTSHDTMIPDEGSNLVRTNEAILELYIQFSLSCLPASSLYSTWSKFLLPLINCVHAKAIYRISHNMSERGWMLLQLIHIVHHMPD